MARRKNYSFERAERDRQKAAKKVAKREAKAAARAVKDDPELEATEGTSEVEVEKVDEAGP